MNSLDEKIALVAGASRGAGRGVALALGDAGATVYVTGRTVRGGPPPPDGAPGTVDDTADEVTARGGKGIAVRADHTVEEDIARVVEQIEAEQGCLDILVNAVWGGNESFGSIAWGKPFWEQPASGWPQMMEAGVRAYLLTSQRAAALMAKTGGGLIVHVTDGGEDYFGQIYWDLSHAAINRLALAMGREGKKQGIAAVALHPGFMRTERVLMHVKTEEDKKRFGFDKSESPEYIGRAVVALADDEAVLNKSGKLHYVGDLAAEYGFTDIDGRYIPRFVP